jgi:hypothetical protein
MLASCGRSTFSIENEEGEMSSKVYWVDEDERIWAPERSVLRGLGFEVIPIGDASTALSLISTESPSNVRLLILDVMLLPGEDHVAFPEDTTNGGTETGLILAEKLYSINIQFGPRILFFSRATRASIIKKTERLVARIGGFYLPKSTSTQGKHFVEWLRANKFIEGV